jgi:hypothetical protein
MAATAHLTAAAPDNEKFTVPIGAKQIAQAQSLLTSPRSGDGSNYNWPAPKPFRAGKRGRIGRKRKAHSPPGRAGGRGGRGGGGGGLGLGLGLGLGCSAALDC